MKLRYFFLAFFFVIKSFSQVYIPIDTTKNDSYKTFVADFTSTHKEAISLIKNGYSGDFKREIVKLHEEQFEAILKDFNNGEVYFEEKNQKYLTDLLGIIIKFNPELSNKGIKIHFSRENNPNAFSIGDGTIIIHLNLLKITENEGELVDVICHEIAHYILNHREKSYKKNVENITSKKFKKEVRDISNLKYNKQKRAENLLKDALYTRKSKSRAHEIEADSLGMIYFNKTNYNPKHALNLLNNLENSDFEKDSLVEKDLRLFFTTQNQKFLEEWLEKEDFSGYNYSKEHLFKWNIDSLKTHPDCKERIEKIEVSNTFASTKNFQLDAKYFNTLKQVANYETVANLYYFKKYGYSLYEALKLLKEKKDDAYLLEMVSDNLVLLEKAKREFKFNKYIPSINPKEQTNSEQLFINFMNNLTPKELERLSNDYIKISRKQ